MDWSIPKLSGYEYTPINSRRRREAGQPAMAFYLSGNWAVKEWNPAYTTPHDIRAHGRTLETLTSAVDMAWWLNVNEMEPTQ